MQGARRFVIAVACTVFLIGFASSQPRGNSHPASSKFDASAEEDLDWRRNNAVSRVKDQGARCHFASQIFAAVDAIESAYNISQKKQVELSAQQVMDCAPYSCGHGDIGKILLNIMVKCGGLEAEDSYPFIGLPNKCKFDKTKMVAAIDTFMGPSNYNEDALKSSIATYGPAATTIDASHESFLTYQSGVYFEPKCDNTTRQHGVLVVGYGTDPSEGDYWILKNSWGELWGEAGYMRMARNRGDPCGLAIQPYFPFIAL